MHSWTFEIDGREFVAELHHDSDMGAPWDEHDGHGDVSEWTTRDKRPGEMVIASDGRRNRFYDFAGAVKRARAESWDAPPYRAGTRGQRAARAALADFKRLKEWCDDEWSWCGVVVRSAGACECCGESRSLWGLESDCAADHKDAAEELARELLHERAAAA